jgi:class 3 adenylate cyclase
MRPLAMIAIPAAEVLRHFMLVCTNCGKQSEVSFAFCPYCAAPFSAERVQRKLVTVLFCDVVGSTALGEVVDAEAVRSLLALFFEQMKALVEAHGGIVDKFIGDAVMAIFGVPVAHEDDALRALRAAQEMRQAIPELGLQARIGVNRGEVVTGTAERLATGDAVNVAARLEQAAEPGQVLLGVATMRLVGEAVDTAPLGSLELKGKSEPVPAWRLLSLRGSVDHRLRVSRCAIGSSNSQGSRPRLSSRDDRLAVRCRGDRARGPPAHLADPAEIAARRGRKRPRLGRFATSWARSNGMRRMTARAIDTFGLPSANDSAADCSAAACTSCTRKVPDALVETLGV